YQPFRPVPASWQNAGFADYLQRLAAREGLPLPGDLDLAACEAAGWQRHHQSRRLQLVRLAFRRAIEVWLLCDLAAWLEKQGYSVTLREFCARSLTPRNLLLSARLL
ncbi:MAG TPA: methyltransferase, partial [Rhodocyclaceae bacterium]|nr:methyltransferase [Rhodocyclaceae bacterium]